MLDRQSSEPFDQTTRKLILQTARRMDGMGRDGLQDEEDYAQELTLRLLERLAAYRPERGAFHAFVRTILQREAASILRDRLALKRPPRKVHSLQSRVKQEEGGSVELASTLTAADGRRRRGLDVRDHAELLDLVIDIAIVLESLSASQRRLAERLQSQSISAIAREEGVSPETISKRVQKLRKVLEQGELQAYLGKNSSLTEGLKTEPGK